MAIIGRNGDYSNRHIIVCEGYSDVTFLDALLANRGITKYDIGCPNQTVHGADGISGIPSYLEALRAHRNGKTIETLVVVVDADTDHAKAFRSVCSALTSADADFLPPSKPWEFSNNAPRTGIVIIPKPEANGTMEHLLSEAAFSANFDLKVCIESFAACVGTPASWSSNKIAKMKASSAIAVTCEDDPAASLSWIWKKKAKDNPFPLASPVFDILANFFTA